MVFACSDFFLVVLDDGLGGGVVDVELLGYLNDKGVGYIDDAPSFLNASEQFRPYFFSYFFVFFGGLSMFYVDGSHFLEN